MIYFLQPVDGGPIKIGFSEDVESRRNHLEWTYGRSLAILATIEGGRDTEGEIHARFSHLRLGRTEQFRPAPDLMAFIGRPLLAVADPESIEAMPSLIKPLVVQMRGSKEYKKWLEDFAEREGETVTQLCVRAMRWYAKTEGQPDPPRR